MLSFMAIFLFYGLGHELINNGAFTLLWYSAALQRADGGDQIHLANAASNRGVFLNPSPCGIKDALHGEAIAFCITEGAAMVAGKIWR